MSARDIRTRITPILFDTYGQSDMTRALIKELARKIAKWPNVRPTYGAESREDMIRLTCWDWFSGGTTAESVAREIEAALSLDGSSSECL